MLQGWPLAPVLLSLVTAAGCLHARPATRGDGCRDPGAGCVTVRFSDPRDAAFARRVREALPAALPLAGRFGELRAPVTLTIHPTHASLEAAAGKAGYAWLRAWARPDAIEVQ